MEMMPENIIHQLFLELGCNLDYIPTQKYEAFLMCLQFAAGAGFMLWFVKFMFTLLKGFLTGGSR